MTSERVNADVLDADWSAADDDEEDETGDLSAGEGDADEISQSLSAQHELLRHLKNAVTTRQSSAQRAGPRQEMQTTSGPGAIAHDLDSTSRRRRIEQIRTELQQHRQREQESEPLRSELGAKVSQLSSQIHDADYSADSDLVGSDSDSDADLNSLESDNAIVLNQTDMEEALLRDRSADELVTMVVQKEGRIANLTERLTQLESTIAQLQEGLERQKAVSSAVNDRERALCDQPKPSSFTEACEQLHDLQLSLTAREADWQFNCQQLEQQLQQAQERLEKSEEDIKRLEEGQTSVTAENRQLKQKLAQIQLNTDCENSRCASLQSQLDQCRKQLTDSERHVASVTALRRKQLDRLETDNKQLQEQLQKLNESQLKAAELESELSSVRDKIAERERCLSEAADATANLEANIAQLRKTAEVTSENLQCCENKLEVSTAENGALREENKRLQASLDGVNTLLATTHQQLETARSNSLLAQQEQSRVVTEMERAVEAGRARVSELEIALENERRQVVDLNSQLTDLQAKTDDLQTSLESQKNNLAHTLSTLEEQTCRADELGSSLSEERVRAAQAETELCACRTRLAAAEDELVRSGDQLARAKAAEQIRYGLETELRSAEQLIDELKQKCGQLEVMVVEEKGLSMVRSSQSCPPQSDSAPTSSTEHGDSHVGAEETSEQQATQQISAEPPAVSESAIVTDKTVNDLKKMNKKLKIKLKQVMAEKASVQELADTLRADLEQARQGLAELTARSCELPTTTRVESTACLLAVLTSASSEIEQMRNETNSLREEMLQLERDTEVDGEDRLSQHVSAARSHVLSQIDALSRQLDSDDSAVRQLSAQLAGEKDTDSVSVYSSAQSLLSALHTRVFQWHGALQRHLVSLLGQSRAKSSGLAVSAGDRGGCLDIGELDESQKEALLGRQQSKLRQLLAAVKRRTEQRDQANNRCLQLEASEASQRSQLDTLTARLSEVSEQLSTSSLELQQWHSRLEESKALVSEQEATISALRVELEVAKRVGEVEVSLLSVPASAERSASDQQLESSVRELMSQLRNLSPSEADSLFRAPCAATEITSVSSTATNSATGSEPWEVVDDSAIVITHSPESETEKDSISVQVLDSSTSADQVPPPSVGLVEVDSAGEQKPDSSPSSPAATAALDDEWQWGGDQQCDRSSDDRSDSDAEQTALEITSCGGSLPAAHSALDVSTPEDKSMDLSTTAHPSISSETCSDRVRSTEGLEESSSIKPPALSTAGLGTTASADSAGWNWDSEWPAIDESELSASDQTAAAGENTVDSCVKDIEDTELDSEAAADLASERLAGVERRLDNLTEASCTAMEECMNLLSHVSQSQQLNQPATQQTQAQREQLQLEIEKLQQELDLSRAQLQLNNTAHERALTLQSQVAELEDRVACLVDEQQAYRESSQLHSSQMEQELTTARAELADASGNKQRVVELETQVSSLEAQLRQVCTQWSDNECLELKLQLDTSRDQLHSTKTELEETIRSLITLREDSSHKCVELTAENGALSAKLGQLQAELFDLKQCLTASRQQCLARDSENQLMADEMTQCRRRNDELEHVLGARDHCYIACSMLMQKMVGQLTDDMCHMEGLERERDVLLAELNELRMRALTSRSAADSICGNTVPTAIANTTVNLPVGVEEAVDHTLVSKHFNAETDSDVPVFSMFGSESVLTPDRAFDPFSNITSAPSQFCTSTVGNQHTESSGIPLGSVVQSDGVTPAQITVQTEMANVPSSVSQLPAADVFPRQENVRGSDSLDPSVPEAASADPANDPLGGKTPHHPDPTVPDAASEETPSGADIAGLTLERDRLTVELAEACRALDTEREFKLQMEQQLEKEVDASHQLRLHVLEAETRADTLQSELAELGDMLSKSREEVERQIVINRQLAAQCETIKSAEQPQQPEKAADVSGGVLDVGRVQWEDVQQHPGDLSLDAADVVVSSDQQAFAVSLSMPDLPSASQLFGSPPSSNEFVHSHADLSYSVNTDTTAVVPPASLNDGVSAQLQTEVSRLQAELSRLRAELDSRDLSALQAEIRRLVEQLQVVTDRDQYATAEVERLGDELSRLREQLQVVTDREQHATAEVERLGGELSRLREQLQVGIDREQCANTEVARLSSELSRLGTLEVDHHRLSSSCEGVADTFSQWIHAKFASVPDLSDTQTRDPVTLLAAMVSHVQKCFDLTLCEHSDTLKQISSEVDHLRQNLIEEQSRHNTELSTAKSHGDQLADQLRQYAEALETAQRERQLVGQQLEATCHELQTTRDQLQSYIDWYNGWLSQQQQQQQEEVGSGTEQHAEAVVADITAAATDAGTHSGYEVPPDLLSTAPSGSQDTASGGIFDGNESVLHVGDTKTVGDAFRNLAESSSLSASSSAAPAVSRVFSFFRGMSGGERPTVEHDDRVSHLEQENSRLLQKLELLQRSAATAQDPLSAPGDGPFLEEVSPPNTASFLEFEPNLSAVMSDEIPISTESAMLPVLVEESPDDLREDEYDSREVQNWREQLAAEREKIQKLESELTRLRAECLDESRSDHHATECLSSLENELSHQREISSQEIESLQRRLSDLESSLATASDELKKSKVKNGRLLQRLKQVQKEAANSAEQSEVSTAVSPVPDPLDAVLMDDLRRQLEEWQRRAGETDRYCRQLQQEKTRLTQRLTTLEEANERLVDAKESLDAELARLSAENTRLRAEMSDMEWRLAELQESLGDEQSAESVTHQLTEMREMKVKVDGRVRQLEEENGRLLERLESMERYDQNVQQQLPAVEELQIQLDAAQTQSERLSASLQTQCDKTASQQQQQQSDVKTSGYFSQMVEAAVDESNPHLDQEKHEEEKKNQEADGDTVPATLLRSREAIINNMADELQSQRATNAALTAETAHWRSLAEHGEDGDVVRGLSQQLRQLDQQLHSRELRCSELTSEVAQLLEERDLLQLRLSSSLRQQQEHASLSPTATEQQLPNSSQYVAELQIKLAELKKVNYMLDIQLQDEISEKRRLQRSLASGFSSVGRSPQVALSRNMSELLETSSVSYDA